MEFPDLPTDSWKALEVAFAWARTQDPVVRDGFLEELASSFPEILDDLRSMLQDASADRFERPDFHEDVIPAAVGPESRVGDRIGAFEVTGVIASGGMGDVLKARRDDGAFEQVVAIKLLREGLQHGSFADRFLRERQTLAQLHHPNICGLLDGGDTEDGIPYLVMEFVEGLDILQYAEQRRLSIASRVQLAIRICDAVQYAHQHLVIHRDLKPGNILVDEEGHPSLLDFGIAKLLDPEAAGEELTMAQFPVMTPAYASPEQVRGEAVGTASDVYSLGMVFYRLFGGDAPYDLDGLSRFDLAKTVSEVAVAPLQQADRRFPQDLDAILAQCLRKDPQRRYASVHALAEDLQRFGKGLPVQARADSIWYRTRRFLGRNRLPVSFAAVALLAGVIGLSAFIHSSKIAMRKALTTSRVSTFLVEFFSPPDPRATGLSEMSMHDFFDHGLERMFLDLEGEPEVRGELASTLGEVLLNLGDEEQAMQVLGQALET
ncbi:MAG: serine/threonine protein kinase, partial [Planctomycetota bacterium]